MTVSSLVQHGLLTVTTRVACESSLRTHVRDLETPSRIASFVHGVLCSLMLADGNWSDAVASTGLFFVLDAIMTGYLRRGLPWDTAFHHALGAILCLYSVLANSFEDENHGAELTKALILMETTNPFLHGLVSLRKEKLEHKLPPWTLKTLQGIFLAQFAALRLGLLGRALFNLSFDLSNSSDFEVSMFWISLSMWTLQWMWFGKLVSAAKIVNH
jgi:hypothetical protein